MISSPLLIRKQPTQTPAGAYVPKKDSDRSVLPAILLAVTDKSNQYVLSCLSLLFHRALYDSAVFAQKAGCDESKTTPQQFRDCIRRLPGEELMDVIRSSWSNPNWPDSGEPSIARTAQFLYNGYVDLLPSSMAGRLDFPFVAPVVFWTPTEDGTVDGLPEMPYIAIKEGRHNKVPVVSLTNRVSEWCACQI